MFHISKEHQITTGGCPSPTPSHCFTFQKSIKSQLAWFVVFHRLDCFTFQKSIKSQLLAVQPCAEVIVSHFKRASNHNWGVRRQDQGVIVSHFKRASNHNSWLLVGAVIALFHISKEHQISIVKERLCVVLYHIYRVKRVGSFCICFYCISLSLCVGK